MGVETLQDFGPYQIVRRIAVGGMAEIYLARQRGLEGLERTVVIKRILERYARDDEFITMFLDEARLMGALSHPNIAQVFDLGKVGNAFYLVMEYIRGPTLGRLLTAADKAGGMPLAQALSIALAVCEALHYVHERRDELGRSLNIVHRDLNPANVIVGYEGAVKLIDFGIAKAATKVYETRSGVIKGTYGYISPEQLTGSAVVDRRADVFALGILLYEMVVGSHPYDVSDEPNLIDRILEARYRRPRDVKPDIPPDLDRVIASCLAPHPEGRPESMGALMDGLITHMASMSIVPTQRMLSEYTHSVVPDSEGARPVKPLTTEHRLPMLRGKGNKGPSTRVSRAPNKARASAPPPPPTFSASEAPTKQAVPNPNADLWSEATIRVSKKKGNELVEAMKTKSEPPPATVRRSSRPPPAPQRGSRGEEEAPTTLMAIPPERKVEKKKQPLADSGPPRIILFLLGMTGVLGVGLAAYIAARALDRPEANPQTASPPHVASPSPDAGSDASLEQTVRLRIVSRPPGATITLNNQTLEGHTPLEVVIRVPEPGTQVWVRGSLEGYQDAERLVNPRIGETTLDLRPLARDAGSEDGSAEAQNSPEASERARPARRRASRRRRPSKSRRTHRRR